MPAATQSQTLIHWGCGISRRFLTRFTIFLWGLQTIFRSVLGRCFGANTTSADLIDVQRPTNMASTQASNGDWYFFRVADPSMTVTEQSAGTVTYSITCTGAPPAATASASVSIVTATATAPASTSSHGGGAIDSWSLMGLGGLVGASLVRRRRGA